MQNISHNYNILFWLIMVIVWVSWRGINVCHLATLPNLLDVGSLNWLCAINLVYDLCNNKQVFKRSYVMMWWSNQNYQSDLNLCKWNKLTASNFPSRCSSRDYTSSTKSKSYHLVSCKQDSKYELEALLFASVLTESR